MIICISIILVGLFLYLMCNLFKNFRNDKYNLSKTILWIHIIILTLSFGFLIIIFICAIIAKHNFISWFHLLLLAYGQNIVIEFIDILYLYLRIKFCKLKLWKVICVAILGFVMIFLIGVMFKSLFKEYSISVPYKFASFIGTVYVIAYDTVQYYSNYYMYELTNNNCDTFKLYIRKKFNLKFYELLTTNCSIVYTLLTFLFIEQLSSKLRLNIQNYQINFFNFISSTTLELSSIALDVFVFTSIIVFIITVFIRYCIRKYYGVKR